MLRQIISLLLIAVSVWAWGCGSKPFSHIKVIDGDTVVIDSQKVRLAEIDAPEISQKYGIESKAYLESLIVGKQVTLKPKNTDKYGRTIGYLIVDGQDVSTLMVKNGYAWAYMSKPAMYSLERQARYKHIGLWSFPNPVRPSQYRKARLK